jgi:GAF domain-containing protein
MSTANTPRIPYTDKNKFYKELINEASGLLESDWLMNLANISALLKQHLPDTNWIGFYLNRNNELLLGPFQGLPACTRIPLGKGVCGTSAQTQKSILVDDVDLFPGHITCDSASRSELVIPIIKDQKVIGVLDIDSPSLKRFDELDRVNLERIVDILVEKTDWKSGFHL